MTPFLGAALGMSLGAAVLHAALGLRRPLRRTYLTFACMMALLAVFLYLQSAFYKVTEPQAAIELTRRQFAVVHGFVGCMLVFIPAYTNLRLPRVVMTGYWAVLVALFVANLVSPYGVWYAEPPELVHTELLGRPYNAPVAQAMGLVQFTHAALLVSVLALAGWCAVQVIRRGERQRGIALAVGAGVIFVSTVVDYVRDVLGGSWPYMSEFGVVAWALVMSVQLAHDFRIKAQALARAIADVELQATHLTSMLDALHALEQNMDAPLQTLEAGVAALGDGSGANDVDLQRLERAVARLREFSRSMPGLSTRTNGAHAGATA